VCKKAAEKLEKELNSVTQKLVEVTGNRLTLNDN
jgi:hypothetical protein